MMSHHVPVDPLRSRLPRHATAVAHLSRVLPAIARQAGFGAALLVSAREPVLVDPAYVTIESDAGRARLRFDLSCSPALESIVADRNDARRTALANLFLAPWLAALQPAGTGALVVRHIGRDRGGDMGSNIADDVGAVPWHDDRRLAHGVALAIAADTPCVVDDIDASLVEALARGLANAAPAPAPDAHDSGTRAATHDRATDLRRCRLAGRLHLATRTLRLDVLNTLRVGDVVLGWPLPGPYQPGAPLRGLALRWGAPRGMQAHARVATHGSQLILETPLTMNEDTQDDAVVADRPLPRPLPTEAAPDAGTASVADADASMAVPTGESTVVPTLAPLGDLGAMTVPVRVELVTLELSLDAIAALHPGSIVELPAPLDSAVVQLVCCGHTVAHGQLVAVGDNLGVRIVQSTQVPPAPSAAVHGR